MGEKHDEGKLRYDLIPPGLLEQVAAVLTYGAAKYSDNGWKSVEGKEERYTAAAMRHFEAWRSGETLDPESKLHHLAHAAACLSFLLHFEGAALTADLER